MPNCLFTQSNQKIRKLQQSIPENRGDSRNIRRYFGVHPDYPMPYVAADSDPNALTPYDLFKWHAQWLRSAWAFIDESSSQMESWYQTLSLAVPSDIITSAESSTEVNRTYRGAPFKGFGNVAVRTSAKSLLVFGGATVGGVIGSGAGPGGAYVGDKAGGYAAKQACNNLERMAGKKYDLNTRIKLLYPSVRRTDVALNNALWQRKKHSDDSLEAMVAQQVIKRGIKLAPDSVSAVAKFIPTKQVYEYIKIKNGLSDQKINRMWQLLDELEYTLMEQLSMAKEHLKALNMSDDSVPSLGLPLNGVNKFHTRYLNWKSEKESRITPAKLQKAYADTMNWIRRNRALLEVIAAHGIGPYRNFAAPLATAEGLNNEATAPSGAMGWSEAELMGGVFNSI